MLALASFSDKCVSVAPFQMPDHFADDPVATEYTAFFRFAGFVSDSRTG